MRWMGLVCTCVAAVSAGVVGLAGCGGGSGDGGASALSPLGSRQQQMEATNQAAAVASAPAAPSIDGSWRGVFLDATTGGRRSLTASITQDGDTVTIDTSLSGLGGYFTGTIQSDGFLWLTDAWDGETWTTLGGAASGSYIVIQDYVTNPDDPDELLLNTIELSR